ncbi:5'-nucleotidase [Rhodococcus rhodochrous]|nr:5'-nucleotidase [Rhodococcus rhodochrous]
MRALIVNDDGVDSHGISVLARVAVDAGLDVVVAAPHAERSGASASLSALEEDGRLVVAPRAFPDLPDTTVLAVEASPALIAFVSMYGAFGPKPDIVLSGINHGPNTGHAILHSGTVGAALTGANHGSLALAVSLSGSVHEHWEGAGVVARHALQWVLTQGTPGTVLNVNVPDIPLSELRGLRTAPLAAFGAVQADIGETDQDPDDGERQYVTVTFSDIRADEAEDTDAGLLAQGWATATALRSPFEAADVDTADLPRTAADLV